MGDPVNEEEDSLAKIEYYLEIGAIKFAGYDEYGEVLFEINEKVTKDLAPELWYAHEDYVEDGLLDLLERNLMRVDYDENLEATMVFTEEGYDAAKRMGIIPLEDI
jgi:hypothetical protein